MSEEIKKDEIVINTENDIFIYLTEFTWGYVRKDICERRHMRYYLEPICVTEEEQTKLYKYIETLYS